MDFSMLATSSRILLRHLLESNDTTTQKDYHLLSATSEAELLLLSTNFLLYVALVIITTMVCKIYFPEALERGSPIVRSYSYRMVEDAMDENESYYGSDVSDDDDEENEEVLDSSSSEDNDREQQQQQQSAHSLMEFDQTRLSKAQVLKRLALCSLILNVTFVAWGVLQVKRECAAV